MKSEKVPQNEPAVEKARDYEYYRVRINLIERQKLMVLVAKRNCTTIPSLLRLLMLEALTEAEKTGLFANLDFLK